MDKVFVNQDQGRDGPEFFEFDNIVPRDLRVLPLLLSGTFLLVQVVYASLHQFKSRGNNENLRASSIAPAAAGTRNRGLMSKMGNSIRLRGGYTIFGFMVARLLGTLGLLYLSATTLGGGCQTSDDNGVLSKLCPQDYLTISFAYATVSAVSSFWPNPRWLSPVRFHVIILLSALGVYIYRDIWPLATNSGLQPADISEGKVLWLKISLLTLIAVIIPLFIPHPYVPVDPKSPAPIPNPEQTASWISFFTYSFVDPLILLANKVPHLRHDQLPPLADYDFARYLSSSASSYIDPFAGAKRRHLFFGLLSYFRKEYAIINICLLLVSASSFAAPIGINKTLSYLETHQYGDKMTIKPWVWISLMLLGPILHSVFEHWNLFIQTQVRVRIQALLTQLIFEHSLRIRMKAETSSEGQSTTSEQDEDPSLAGLDSSSSVIEGEHQGREDSNSEYTQASTAVGSREASSTSEFTQTTAQPGGKGKTKADEGPPVKKSSGDAENLIGRINNLVTSDLENIVEGCDLFALIVLVPIQIILSIVFLYKVLGWSALVGLFTTIALGPIPGYLSKLAQDVQITKMKLTDARVQSITEAVGVLRMIKLFGWEGKMTKRIETKREEELTWLWKIKKLRLGTELISAFIPTFSMLVTYAAYTILMKEGLTASKIFSSMAVFSILREQLTRIAWQVSLVIEARVSLDRASSFLQNTELLDSFAKKHDTSSGLTLPAEEDQHDTKMDIGFRNATFSWSLEDDDGLLTPSSRKYRLHIDGELLFKRNAINLIVGPTGSGKTSILMALLGEMHFIPARADSWFNLPRQGGVAYAAQESWVQNATIKENITFGSPFDEERYKKVIRQCALEHDLELFDAGDETEVGERGLTLSGGQKARVTLARAIYSPAETILLDDVLAALDVHTSAWIVEQCFRGDLVKGRTILLVTHNVALAGPVADFIISLSLDGSVKVQDTESIKNELNHATSSKQVLEEDIEAQADILQETKDGKQPFSTASDGKLVMAEEIVEGHITWRSMKLLFVGLGGKHPIFFGANWLGGMVLAQFLIIIQPWFLGVWGSQYETRAPSEVHLQFYLLVFSVIIISRLTTYSGLNLYYQYRSISASRIIHAELVKSVFGSTLRWLDETPTARIIARCTQDIRTVDGPIPQSLMWVADQGLGVISSLGSIVLFTPVFLFPGIAVGLLGIFVGNMYLRAQLSIKREMSNARSPVLAHFSAAIHGLVSIRAYGSQKAFAEESFQRINHYSRTARTSWVVNRWVGFRIDALGAIFTSGLAFYLVYGKGGANAGNAGFSLNMAVNFCLYIFWLIRIFNELEVESNSLERIQGYIDIEHEPKPSVSGEPPAAWPTSGDLRVEGLSARYSQSGPKVLHDLTFHIASGERIGIVGRTGSGKSSLTLSLLRCILTEGTVIYDGIATNTLNLDALRSNVTIIPQTPELLSGTLRQNLDPFDQNDDATLNDALRAAGLFSLQEDAGEARLTLESKIAGGGNNLSVGQRQIIALARAMVRGSKLLILDEATSAIDYNTDSIIQSTLRNKLGPDVTVITVAHRLQTIMDADKIMVLDNGKIAEFDAPKVLLEKDNGTLRALVEGSGDKALLYSLANKK